MITVEAAQAIGLAIHELATNAVKYGALSRATGKVQVIWKLDANGPEPKTVVLNWIEEGGPPVAPPIRKGFGHIVLDQMIASSLDGAVRIEFAAKGLKWTVSIPAHNLRFDAEQGAF